VSVQNMGASIRNRLLDKARTEKLDFNLLLTRYALERMLYRLSISAQYDQFLLSGSMCRIVRPMMLICSVLVHLKFLIWKRFFVISAALKSRMASCSSLIP
jgi:hypothetical protein